LEKEFDLSYDLKIPFNYNDDEFFEFVWRYERLVEQRRRENEAKRLAEGQASLSNLSPELLKTFKLQQEE
jgi:hypothetical protein